MKVVECLCLRRMPSKGRGGRETGSGRQMGDSSRDLEQGQEQGEKVRVRMVLSG